ncbi:MAG: hypothetical protein EBZ59_05120, partial [Planctomycetia bacterium]|nr:hypothetical protein [Planctomycetia bacterium]
MESQSLRDFERRRVRPFLRQVSRVVAGMGGGGVVDGIRGAFAAVRNASHRGSVRRRSRSRAGGADPAESIRWRTQEDDCADADRPATAHPLDAGERTLYLLVGPTGRDVPT